MINLPNLAYMTVIIKRLSIGATPPEVHVYYSFYYFGESSLVLLHVRLIASIPGTSVISPIRKTVAIIDTSVGRGHGGWNSLAQSIQSVNYSAYMTNGYAPTIIYLVFIIYQLACTK